MKRCNKCGETKPRAAFTAHESAADGYNPTCKACRANEARAQRKRGGSAIDALRARERAASSAKRSTSPEACVLADMIKRCHNPRTSAFASYGGRGIRVADEWRGKGGPVRFLAHVGVRPSPAHTIERVDNDGHYEPGNVRWATHAEQALNRRTNRRVEIEGVSLCIVEWARRIGVDKSTIRRRLEHGVDPRIAVTEPARPRRAWPKEALRRAAQ